MKQELKKSVIFVSQFMELSDIGILCFLIGVMVFFIWTMRTKKLYSKKDKIFLKKQQERLDDERVYDEVTGRFYTIEELENGTVYEPADDNKPYSDEEIE
jgi:hypothetical protein